MGNCTSRSPKIEQNRTPGKASMMHENEDVSMMTPPIRSSGKFQLEASDRSFTANYPELKLNSQRDSDQFQLADVSDRSFVAYYPEMKLTKQPASTMPPIFHETNTANEFSITPGERESEPLTIKPGVSHEEKSSDSIPNSPISNKNPSPETKPMYAREA